MRSFRPRTANGLAPSRRALSASLTLCVAVCLPVSVSASGTPLLPSNGHAQGTKAADLLARVAVQQSHGIVNAALPGPETADFPATGGLLRDSLVSCTATLIGCQTVLTAAHCFADRPDFIELDPAKYSVFFQNAGFFQVESIALNPEYATVSGGTVTFGDSDADIAVIKLAEPVTGITPQPLPTSNPYLLFTGGQTAPATIAGFGSTALDAEDYGLKRWGRVAIEGCPDSAKENLLCSHFESPVGPAGEDSNTCFGDSGGPLFLTIDGTEVVAGVIASGTSADCLAPDTSFETSVYYYLDFVEAELGLDPTSACGAVAPVGAAGTSQAIDENFLELAGTSVESFEVPAGVQQLRIAVNGIDDFAFDPNLLVRHGSPPSVDTWDCDDQREGPFGYCQLEFPQIGTWYIEVSEVGSAGGTYQRMITQVPEPAGSAMALAAMLALGALLRRAR